MFWTDEKKEVLKKLWFDPEISASVIAQYLGATSRNAVIGKAQRMGLPGRKSIKERSNERWQREKAQEARKNSVVNKKLTKSNNSKKPNNKKPNSTPEPQVDPSAPCQPGVPTKYAIKNIVDLEPNQCKFSYGDPQEEDFFFCGKPRVPGYPYCESCCLKAYQPLSTSTRKAVRKAA